MLEMTLRLPGTLTQLPALERDILIRAGLYEAVRARIRQLEADLAESKAAIGRFEASYGMSLQRFEADVLPNLDSLKIHEDYNDWFYWQSLLEEKQLHECGVPFASSEI